MEELEILLNAGGILVALFFILIIIVNIGLIVCIFLIAYKVCRISKQLVYTCELLNDNNEMIYNYIIKKENSDNETSLENKSE